MPLKARGFSTKRHAIDKFPLDYTFVLGVRCRHAQHTNPLKGDSGRCKEPPQDFQKAKLRKDLRLRGTSGPSNPRCHGSALPNHH